MRSGPAAGRSSAWTDNRADDLALAKLRQRRQDAVAVGGALCARTNPCASEELLRAEGTIVSAERLLEKAWDENIDPFTHVVRVTIMTLRRKLGDPPLIETIPGAQQGPVVAPVRERRRPAGRLAREAPIGELVTQGSCSTGSGRSSAGKPCTPRFSSPCSPSG